MAGGKAAGRCPSVDAGDPQQPTHSGFEGGNLIAGRQQGRTFSGVIALIAGEYPLQEFAFLRFVDEHRRLICRRMAASSVLGAAIPR